MDFTFPIILSFITLLIKVTLAADFVPKDNILVNCGSFDPQTTDSDGRVWSSDNGSKFMLSTKDTFRATAATQSQNVKTTPYMSARIMYSNTTYSFTVSPGRKFLRVYFYPNIYSRSNSATATFSVMVGAYTLLKNFNVFEITQEFNVEYIVKEYYINVEEGDALNVTFVPSLGSKSFAFVNGIEVVSVPSVYDNDMVNIVGASIPFPIDNYTALESLYRFNVGGSYISPTNDTGLFRFWYDDTPYVYGAMTGTTTTAGPEVNITFPKPVPSYTAPVDVYSTTRFMTQDNKLNLKFNLTWLLPIQSGFAYMVRLHFCQIFSDLEKVNQIVFNVYLNNVTAYSGVDIVALTENHHNGIPYVMDFVMLLPTTEDDYQDLLVELQPEIKDKPQYYNAFLNGLELFKINNTDGSLAHPFTVSS